MYMDQELQGDARLRMINEGRGQERIEHHFTQYFLKSELREILEGKIWPKESGGNINRLFKNGLTLRDIVKCFA